MGKGARNRRERPTVGDQVSDVIAAQDGAHIPGGCEDCDAYQVVKARQGHRRVHILEVYHDDDCPTLARMEKIQGV